jgi:hypothetical protein
MSEALRGQTAEPDLNLLGRHIERLLTELASLRDDVRVLTAIVMRQDNTLTTPLQEMRATHEQIARMNDRIRKLEDAVRLKLPRFCGHPIS